LFGSGTRPGGWGVLDSEETPGGCWAHFSSVDMAGYRTAGPGQAVDFTYESVPQDGFDYRALTVRVRGVPGAESHAVEGGDLGYSSTLRIDLDATR
jgi:CspA family cold shock protein